mmetsp:Transcript_18714/g.17826  ORF Transcript_18714/g.17826 Transcript_18714/m.17826 type:complete len:102 (+) Transcript_18714:1-306(+)|eukprot:CAMPEP_0170543258 /NCGR_PEP_ID=MMETSP0211-20121228/2435_1 /TAXON_ID=311385 /ORGANISM="Pseudokeronopsis sp., Strain OXSARD2" /LENGTH=101 /DNA_ID=CAMNT_0010846583 /DNA_START=1 /DNA_END=306 /DNA_ORIENTATION=-
MQENDGYDKENSLVDNGQNSFLSSSQMPSLAKVISIHELIEERNQKFKDLEEDYHRQKGQARNEEEEEQIQGTEFAEDYKHLQVKMSQIQIKENHFVMYDP